MNCSRRPAACPLLIQRPLRRFVLSLVILLSSLLGLAHVSPAQTEVASVSGTIVDRSGGLVPGIQVTVINTDTNEKYEAKTNNAGVYNVPSVKPGHYRILVTKPGFKQIDLRDFTLNVQDSVNRNFTLDLGGVSETVIVNAGDSLNINTTDATVSTVVDRQFAENLPMNGRSFQTLIQLTPGVVVIPTNANDTGQFSVNGQRASSNYWTLDGVSANVGVGATFNVGNGVGGSLGSFSALGGTNSLVSVDALQEFRIQTSTYAPEFGRTPGAQISIVTRSGTNQFHGTLFDYFRNDILDANNWFADFGGLSKPPERQNDFGGTFSGPILKNSTFFFFSYEGLRLRLPQTVLTTVPDLSARQSAIPAMQPILNAFPFDPNQLDLGNGKAQFNSSFSNPATLDAYSLRVDRKLSDRLNLFGRYSYSPSKVVQRGSAGGPLSRVFPNNITAQAGTVGATLVLSQSVTNDFRFNYSRTSGASSFQLDRFGGAVPPSNLPFPNSFTVQDSRFLFRIGSLTNPNLWLGTNTSNLQQQINIVDGLSMQRGSHSLKIGVDFRRLSPQIEPYLYDQEAFFGSVPRAEAGRLSFTITHANNGAALLFHNLGVFVQDTWRVLPRLTLTYGLRWDVDFAPSTTSGPNIAAVTNFNDIANLALAPTGTSPFNTTYGNLAPRVGLAFQVSQSKDWQTVLRGGSGVFFDLATSEAGNLLFSGYPFTAANFISGGTFPLDPTRTAPPPITPASLTSSLTRLSAFDPGLQLPYTLQWNLAVDQLLGRRQSISASYIGSVGRRLLQTEDLIAPNSNFAEVTLVGNTSTSDYHALQIQFQRQLSRGLQTLASYTWSHSIDTASGGSLGNVGNAFVPGVNPNANRGPSDFDIREAFSAGVTYEIPAPKINAFTNAILRGWSLQNVIVARSSPPVELSDGNFSFATVTANVRPDIVPGQPFYLFGSQYPGRKAFNPAAFTDPPFDPTTFNPLRQGTTPRNFLRGFGATQWDFGVHRDFLIHESVKLQFRAEMFNVLNHPNFAQPIGDISNPQFGLSTQMLGPSLSEGSAGSGGLSPLYQIGGPRSIQFALKLMF